MLLQLPILFVEWVESDAFIHDHALESLEAYARAVSTSFAPREVTDDIPLSSTTQDTEVQVEFVAIAMLLHAE